MRSGADAIIAVIKGGESQSYLNKAGEPHKYSNNTKVNYEKASTTSFLGLLTACLPLGQHDTLLPACFRPNAVSDWLHTDLTDTLQVLHPCKPTLGSDCYAIDFALITSHVKYAD